MNVRRITNSLSLNDSALILDSVFKNKSLWEKRDDRGEGTYRNAEWFTIGTPLYLDGFLPEKDFTKKVSYHNDVLHRTFNFALSQFLNILEKNFPTKIIFLSNLFPVSLPGFHIFPPCASFFHYFGKPHRDLQWQGLFRAVNFPFRLEDVSAHLSITLPLMLPYQGGGMLDGEREEFFQYERNVMYVHDGQSIHSIASFDYPVLPTDYRITMQAHGFTIKDTTYIYW